MGTAQSNGRQNHRKIYQEIISRVGSNFEFETSGKPAFLHKSLPIIINPVLGADTRVDIEANPLEFENPEEMVKYLNLFISTRDKLANMGYQLKEMKRDGFYVYYRFDAPTPDQDSLEKLVLNCNSL